MKVRIALVFITIVEERNENLLPFQLFLNQLQIMPACLFQFRILQEKRWVEGWHKDYFVCQIIGAEIIEIIETAAQLKK